MTTQERIKRWLAGRGVTTYPNGLTVIRHFDDSRLARCCKARCWLHLAYRVARDRDAVFNFEEFYLACDSGPPASYADADTWAMWGLNRLERTPGYKPHAGGKATPTLMSCELHVGFLCLYETPEQLARLRREDVPARVPQEARSKIFQTSKIPTPIDRVAAKVAPPE